MKITNRFTTYTFELYDEYFIDIIIDTKMHEVTSYIYSWYYGIKLFMFGYDLKKITLTEFKTLVEEQAEDYIDELLNRVNK